MTELLIVIGIIVLLVTLAVPAWRLIGGDRSIDSAQNQVSALLARARTDAIALQEIRGVMFYRDPGTGRVGAVIVQARQEAITGSNPVILDILPDRDGLILPTGISLHTFIDTPVSAGNPPTRTNDGYLGFNKVNNIASSPLGEVQVAFGGVILFDAQGTLTSREYSFLSSYRSTTPTTFKITDLGALLFDKSGTAAFKRRSSNRFREASLHQ